MDKNHNTFWPAVNPDQNDSGQEEIIWVSKSEIKRDAETIKKIGLALVELSPNQLAKVPLDAELRAAIALAQKIKKEGYRRQIQWIGKLLRQRDLTPIEYALNCVKNTNKHHTILLQKHIRLCTMLLQTGDTETIMTLYPMANRQKLRTLFRAVSKKNVNKTKIEAQIIHYLKELSDGE